MNGSNKLECYITQGWQSFPGTKCSSLFGPLSYKENEVPLVFKLVHKISKYFLVSLKRDSQPTHFACKVSGLTKHLRKIVNDSAKIVTNQGWDHRHLSNIDCLKARTTRLVCFISTANGLSKKEALKDWRYQWAHNKP